MGCEFESEEQGRGGGAMARLFPSFPAVEVKGGSPGLWESPAKLLSPPVGLFQNSAHRLLSWRFGALCSSVEGVDVSRAEVLDHVTSGLKPVCHQSSYLDGGEFVLSCLLALFIPTCLIAWINLI